jgi:hypothetical protein
MIGDRITMSVVMLVALAVLWFPIISDENLARASEPSSSSLQEQGDGLMRNVEEMVAHGGMGDAKAIVHHCGEAARYAEAIIKQLSASGSRHADPGQLLNPATKARTAAQESIRLLGLTNPKKS